MSLEQKFLLEIIKASLQNKSVTIPTSLDKKTFFNLVKKHSLQVLVYVVFMRSGLKQELSEDFKKEVYKLILGATSLDKDSQAVLNLFKENDLKIVPFKGYNVKKLYPSADMRYSIDFDCLIDEKQLKQVKRLLENNGYKYCKTTDMHLEYLSNSGNVIELHTKLFSRFLPQEFVLQVFSEYTLNNNQLPLETEYIISLAHLASHFVSGGVGVRNIIDLHLLNNKVDRAKLDSKLVEYKLKQFDDNFLSLADVIFNDKEPTEFDLSLFKYVFNSFYLGTESSKELYSVALNFDGDLKRAKRKSVFKKIYPSYKYMAGVYPTLKKHKILLPWFYFVRHLTVIFKRTSHINKLKNISEYNEQEVKSLREILVGLGLDHIKE